MHGGANRVVVGSCDRKFCCISSQELYRTVSFNRVVVIRESLLPLLKAIGISTAPQLRAVCHNQHQLLVDCSLQLREVVVFVLEPLSSRTIPALSLEQASVRGHLHASWDSPAVQPPTLSLLSSGTENTSPHTFKSSISGHFSAQAGIVSIGITTPLLKLCRHLVETAKSISHDQRHTGSLKAATTGSPLFTDRDSLHPQHQPSDLWQFVQDLVHQLRAMQDVANQPEESAPAVPLQISFSRPSSAGSAPSHSVRSAIAGCSHSPRNMSANSPSTDHLSPPATSNSFTVTHRHHTSVSNESSASEVAIEMEHKGAMLATSPASQSPMETSGGELLSSDDMHLSSGSHKAPSSQLPSPTAPVNTSAVREAAEWLADSLPLQRILQTPVTHLSHSMFGLLRINSLSFVFQVESSVTSLKLAGKFSKYHHNTSFMGLS